MKNKFISFGSFLLLIAIASFSASAQGALIDDPDIRSYFLSDSASFEVRHCYEKATKKLTAKCKIEPYHVRASVGNLAVDYKKSYSLNDRWTTYNNSVQLAYINFYDSKITAVDYTDAELLPQKYYRIELVTKNKMADVTSLYDNSILGKDEMKSSYINLACYKRTSGKGDGVYQGNCVTC